VDGEHSLAIHRVRTKFHSIFAFMFLLLLSLLFYYNEHWVLYWYCGHRQDL